MTLCSNVSGGKCTREAVAKVELACVHEHIYFGAGCREHLAPIKKGQKPTCHLCKTGPSPHDCNMTVLPQRRSA